MCSFIVVHERSITKCDLINNIIKTILPHSIGRIIFFYEFIALFRCPFQGRIQDFKLGGGGGGALKKIAPSRGRREHFRGISCEKSLFTPKNHSFYNYGGRREKFWGISCEKSRFYAKKTFFFPILGGTRAGCPPPPPPTGSAPAFFFFSHNFVVLQFSKKIFCKCVSLKTDRFLRFVCFAISIQKQNVNLQKVIV